MATEHPDLRSFQQERIDELEEQNFRRLTGAPDHEMQDATMTRESTATLRAMSEAETPHNAYNLYTTDDEMDIDVRSESGPTESDERLTPLIVATDFGTTFSSIAFARRGQGMLPDINVIVNFPSDPSQMSGLPTRQVPTESWYPNQPRYDEPSRSPTPIQQYLPHASIYDAESDDARSTDEEPLPAEEGPSDQPVSPPRLRSFVWGYGIVDEITPELDQSKFNRIARSKLWLDKSEHTDLVRKDLKPILNRLKRGKIIKTNEDVIADYLARLFMHAKSELIRDDIITEATPIEHVLTVPAIWTADACRKMQKAIAIAIDQSQLGTIDGLFLVSEPEAAATYVLHSCPPEHTIQRGEAFLILDAGGGTVDATTYILDKTMPLRLSKELIAPDGCLKGSSFLNENFKEQLRLRLTGEENDILTEGYTLEGILEKATIEFENKLKRIVDVTRKVAPQYIHIKGLRANGAKRFKNNNVTIERSDFVRIFGPCLVAIEDLMKRQLTSARDAGHEVKNVVLVGGFGTARSLQSYLKASLKDLSREFRYKSDIKLTTTTHLNRNDPEIAVSYGAILRAWKKEDGPERIIKSSYGFEIMEEYNPEVYKEHIGVRPTNDKLDGVKYVHGVIEWKVFKDQFVPSQVEYSLPSVYRIFGENRKKFICEENLWVSDQKVASHYRSTHKENKGAEKAGTIMADMSPLVKSGQIPLIRPEAGYDSKPHYKIEFELVMIINGRNLKFEARWPIGGGGDVQGSTQICIAAAFRPGTD